MKENRSGNLSSLLVPSLVCGIIQSDFEVDWEVKTASKCLCPFLQLDSRLIKYHLAILCDHGDVKILSLTFNFTKSSSQF